MPCPCRKRLLVLSHFQNLNKHPNGDKWRIVLSIPSIVKHCCHVSSWRPPTAWRSCRQSRTGRGGRARRHSAPGTRGPEQTGISAMLYLSSYCNSVTLMMEEMQEFRCASKKRQVCTWRRCVTMTAPSPWSLMTVTAQSRLAATTRSPAIAIMAMARVCVRTTDRHFITELRSVSAWVCSLSSPVSAPVTRTWSRNSAAEIWPPLESCGHVLTRVYICMSSTFRPRQTGARSPDTQSQEEKARLAPVSPSSSQSRNMLSPAVCTPHPTTRRPGPVQGSIYGKHVSDV